MKLTIDGEYHQFYLEDDKKNINTSNDFWTEEAFKRNLAISDGCISFGSVTSLDLDVTFEILDSPPSLNTNDFDHIIEASIRIESGTFIICGCVDYRPDALHIPTPNGDYRARYCIKDIATVKDEFEGQETYYVYVWPQAYEAVNVIKQQSVYS